MPNRESVDGIDRLVNRPSVDLLWLLVALAEPRLELVSELLHRTVRESARLVRRVGLLIENLRGLMR